MQPHPPLPAVRRPSGDRGAASLEATGMWGLGALLAAVVALALVAAAPGVGDTVRRALCIVVTLGQGSCGEATTSAAEHVPGTPCVVGVEGHDSMVEGSFLFVSAGTGEHWMVEQLSDGRYRVARGTQGNVGATAGVGLTVQGTWDDKPYGVTAAASASAKVGLKEGEVYYAGDEQAVADLLTQHAADVAKDNTVGGSGPVRWAVDGLEELFGGDTQLPEAQERFVSGGLALGADAKATWLAMGGKAGVGVTESLGARIGADGTTTEYLSSTVSGEVAAGTWAGADDGSYEYAQLKAQGSVQTVVELERDADGRVTAVRTRVVTAHEQGATVYNASSGTTAGPAGEGWTERVAELPIRTDADRALATRYLLSVGVGEVAGLVPPFGAVSAPVVLHEAARFATAARARGTVTEQGFDADTSSYALEVGGALIGKIGGSGTVTTTDRTSTGGRYFDGQAWQPWRACG